MNAGTQQSRQVAREWSSRGYQCSFESLPPGQGRAKSIYDTDSVIVVLSGQLEVAFKGATHYPGPGRRLFIPAGAYYTVRNAAPTDTAWLQGLERDIAHTD